MATQTTSNGQFTNQHTNNGAQFGGQYSGQFTGQQAATTSGVQTPWFSGVGPMGTPVFNGFNAWTPGFVPTLGQTLPGMWNNSMNTLGIPFGTINPFGAFNGVTGYSMGFNGFNGFNTFNPFGTFNGTTPWTGTPWNGQFQSPVNGWFSGQTNPFAGSSINNTIAAYGTPITNSFPFTSPISNPFLNSFVNPFTGTINNPFTSSFTNPFSSLTTNPFATGLPFGWNTVNPWIAQTPWGFQNQSFGVQNSVNCPISGDCSCPPGVCVGPTGGTFNAIPTTPAGLVNPIAQNLVNNFGYTQPYGYNLPFGPNASFNAFGGQFPANTQNWTPSFAQNWFQNFTNTIAPTFAGFGAGVSSNPWGFSSVTGTPWFQAPSFVNGISYPVTTGSIAGYPVNTASPTITNTVNPFPVTARWNGVLNPITQNLLAQNLGYGVNSANTFNGFSPVTGLIPGYTPGFAPVLTGLAGGIGSVYGFPSTANFNGAVNSYPINAYSTNPSFNGLANGYTTAMVNGVPTVVPATVNGQATGNSTIGQPTTSPVLVGSCRAAA